MPKKFIPNGDSDFSTMASCFARHVAAEPARFDIAQADCEQLAAAVERFQAALQKCRHGERSESATRAKEDARADAEKIVRRLGNLIRNNARIDGAAKITVGIRPRKEKAKILPCPQEPPRLRFLRAHHEANGQVPMHELEFRSRDWKSRPEGAVRVELFVDLVPPDEPIPAFPGANHGGRPWYLRSYSRSPIKLVPPMPRVPMRVLYWARWVGSLGDVGPFSATAVAWIEGGSHRLLPGGLGLEYFHQGLSGKANPKEIEDATAPANREQKYSVAVLDAQFESLHGPQVQGRPALPAQEEPRQLEGPPADEEVSEAA